MIHNNSNYNNYTATQNRHLIKNQSDNKSTVDSPFKNSSSEINGKPALSDLLKLLINTIQQLQGMTDKNSDAPHVLTVDELKDRQTAQSQASDNFNHSNDRFSEQRAEMLRNLPEGVSIVPAVVTDRDGDGMISAGDTIRGPFGDQILTAEQAASLQGTDTKLEGDQELPNDFGIRNEVLNVDELRNLQQKQASLV